MGIWPIRKYLLRRMAERGIRASPKPRAADALQLLMESEQSAMSDKPIPTCFGVDFAAPEEPKCRSCHVQILCMHRCAHVRLLQEHHEKGTLSVHELSKTTGWTQPVVRRLQNVCRLTGALDASDINRVANPRTEAGIPTKSWPKRFMLERRRMPELNHVKKGTKIIRHYRGEAHIVQFLDGSYLYKGQHYPTLYTVAMAITGHKDYQSNHAPQYRRTMGNYSARKFFSKSIEQVVASS